MLQRGDKGTEVRNLQNALNSKVIWGSTSKLKVDGDFGPATENAVKMFQSQQGLSQTGIADAATLAKLGLGSTSSTTSLLPSFSFNKPISMPMAIGIVGAVAIAALIYRYSRE